MQYTLHDWLPRKSDNFEALAAPKGPKRTYRGPQMQSLFPEENNTGVLDRRAVLVLSVPGLPEASPVTLKNKKIAPV